MNLHRHPLHVDLRGGTVIVLQPGQRSAPLREESLYDNHHLVEWERAGWVARMPARMQEVLDAAAPRPAPKAEERKKKDVEKEAAQEKEKAKSKGKHK
jgi:hypothetical protein